jgi:protein-tyrosine phosphatase
MLRAADLVLTMTDAHTGDVIEMWPRAVRKTFTVREFARLLGAVDPGSLPPASVADRLRAAIPLAAASRRPVVDRTHDDVVDPYRQDDRVYERAFDDIADAVDQIARVIVLDREQERL